MYYSDKKRSVHYTVHVCSRNTHGILASVHLDCDGKTMLYPASTVNGTLMSRERINHIPEVGQRHANDSLEQTEIKIGNKMF